MSYVFFRPYARITNAEKNCWRQARRALGVISLTEMAGGIDSFLPDVALEAPNGFCLVTNSRSYYLAADDQATRALWVKAIQSYFRQK